MVLLDPKDTAIESAQFRSAFSACDNDIVVNTLQILGQEDVHLTGYRRRNGS